MDVPLKTSKSGVRRLPLLRDGRYKVELTLKKRRYYLGTFRELDDVVKARREAEIMVKEYLERYYAEKEQPWRMYRTRLQRSGSCGII